MAKILPLIVLVLAGYSAAVPYFEGGDPHVNHWLFWELWLPRTLVAIGAGAALGLSGAIFQLLTKNPLGSPDIIGINAGASVGAIAVSLIWVNSLPIAVGAMMGALIVLLLILLTLRIAGTFGMQMIVAGIAINAFALALVQFALTGVRQEDAYQISIWLSGSLAQRTWQDVMYIGSAIPIFGLGLWALKRPLIVMRLGDHTAQVLGVCVSKVTLMSLIFATLLATFAVVSAGPITFLALVAPHITYKLFKQPLSLLPTAMVGSILLLSADLLARALPKGSSLPVGVVTSALGGIYLLVLLLKAWKR